MIDWVSIVRNSGQRFSNIIGSSVPLKVRRRRRKRIVAEAQQQQQQTQEQFSQKLNKTLQQQQQSQNIGNSNGGHSRADAGFTVCTCELWKVDGGDEDAGCGNCSVRSASVSGASSTGNYLSTSPGCSSLPGTASSGLSAAGNAVFVTTHHGSFGPRHNSLCEVHSCKGIVSWLKVFNTPCVSFLLFHEKCRSTRLGLLKYSCVMYICGMATTRASGVRLATMVSFPF